MNKDLTYKGEIILKKRGKIFSIKNLDELKIGTKVRYMFYSDLTYEGKQNGHVVLKDTKGNKRRFLEDLFLKYGEVVEEEKMG